MIEGQESTSQIDPWSLYLYAMKSPITTLKYQKRLSSFFEYIGLPEIIEEQARLFAQMGRQDRNWAFNNILKFIKHELERVNRKEIRPGTLRNYVKSIKSKIYLGVLLIIGTCINFYSYYGVSLSLARTIFDNIYNVARFISYYIAISEIIILDASKIRYNPIC